MYKLSIIICTYNSETYISKTLDAIYAQNYPSNLLEIIVIDDQDERKGYCHLLREEGKTESEYGEQVGDYLFFFEWIAVEEKRKKKEEAGDYVCPPRYPGNWFGVYRMNGKKQCGKKRDKKAARQQQYYAVNNKTAGGMKEYIRQVITGWPQPPDAVIHHVRKGDHRTVIPDLTLFLGDQKKIIRQVLQQVPPVLDISIILDQVNIIPDEISFKRVSIYPESSNHHEHR